MNDDADVDEEMARVERAIELVVIEFITEAVANLREVTPKDTTHAAANWIPSRSSPFGEVDGVRTEGKGDEKGSTTAGSAQEAGLVDVFSYTLDDGDAFVANNVPYITGPGSLNDGHSSQAPALFIEFAVYKAQQTVAERHGVEFTNSFEGSG